jgi:hypothetical protein
MLGPLHGGHCERGGSGSFRWPAGAPTWSVAECCQDGGSGAGYRLCLDQGGELVGEVGDDGLDAHGRDITAEILKTKPIHTLAL